MMQKHLVAFSLKTFAHSLNQPGVLKKHPPTGQGCHR